MQLKSNDLSPSLIAILVVSTTISVIAPFDVAFAAVTFGSPFLRALLIAGMVVVGGLCAQRVGFRLEGHGLRSPFALGLAMAAVVAIWICVLDGFLFRHLLTTDYVRFIRSPLPNRMVYFMLRAFNENVIYRLFVFSTLTYLARLLRKPKGLTPALVISAMALAQAINIGMNVLALSSEPATFAVVIYDCLRYIAPGVLWAWLFWRFGFMTAEIASVSCHIFLQPMLGSLL